MKMLVLTEIKPYSTRVIIFTNSTNIFGGTSKMLRTHFLPVSQMLYKHACTPANVTIHLLKRTCGYASDVSPPYGQYFQLCLIRIIMDARNSDLYTPDNEY